jgi:pimeloyl-ACP methyl ester carboxylesterase
MNPVIHRNFHTGRLPVYTLAAALLLTACSEPASRDTNVASSATTGNAGVVGSCAELAGLRFAAGQIGLPTTGATIVTAEIISADAQGNNNGEYCKVLGAIHPVDYAAPDINFQVNLPANWNGKSLQFGGGGLNGTLVTGLARYMKQPDNEATPLARGYVTLGSDSGHQSSGGFDGSFYLNEEALDNFGHMQIKKTHDVAMLLVERHYGQASRFNYFMGGSQGGHEGFDAVQRYPDDYHGVVAGYPAHNVVMLHLSALNYARALAANDGASWMSPAAITFFTSQVYARCDSLDGVEDGIISNVAACIDATQDFRLDTSDNPLRCSNGMENSATCLTSAQIEALNAMDTPYDVGFKLFNDDEGSSIFPKWTPFEGSTFMDGGNTNLGVNGPDTALQRGAGISTNGFAIARDPSLDVMADFDPLKYAGRTVDVASRLSANSVKIDRFRDRGGKLIFFHGTVDDFIPVYSSIQYYQRLLGRYDKAGVDEFVRFYTIPGMGHVTGVFNARLASLDALEAWVEHGVAPGELLATDANRDTAGRTRPVCLYPGWPRYRGTGDVNQAASFECVNP